jgi:hypothetical protein
MQLVLMFGFFNVLTAAKTAGIENIEYHSTRESGVGNAAETRLTDAFTVFLSPSKQIMG